jgi:hypothetical protein
MVPFAERMYWIPVKSRMVAMFVDCAGKMFLGVKKINVGVCKREVCSISMLKDASVYKSGKTGMQLAKMIKPFNTEAPSLHIANAEMAIAMALTWQLHTATWRKTCVRMVHHISLSSTVCNQPHRA